MPQPTRLYEAIPERQNTRSEYDRRPIPGPDLDQILTLPAEPGIRLHLFSAVNELETLGEYVRQGNLHQYAAKAFVNELIEWVHF